MAKSRKYELDDNHFDADFGDSASYFQPERQKKKGARQVATDLGAGFLEGGVDALTDTYLMRRLVRDNVPNSAGQIMDFADDVSRTLGQAYDDAMKDFDPAIQDLRRAVKKYEQPIEKYLPKSVSDAAKRFASRGQYSGMSKEDQITAQITGQLNATLGEGFAQQAKQTADAAARENVKDGIDFERFKGMFGQLNAIRMATEKSSQYQSDVDFKYKRKSLELQFRSLYIAKDMLEESRKQTALNISAYEKLIRNTSLPDYVKLTQAENVKQVLKNKFIGSFSLTGLTKRNQFLRDVSKEVRVVLGEKARSFVDTFRNTLSGAESVNDQVEMASEVGMSPGRLAAGMVGSGVAEHYATKLAGKTGAFAEKHLPAAMLNKIKKTFNQGAYTLNNLPQLGRQWAQSYANIPYLSAIPVVGPMMTEILRDATMNATAAPSAKLDRDAISNLQAPNVWTRQSNRTLNQVIPGYLARIFRELQITRTGDTKTGLTVYDYSKGTFSDHKTIKAGIFKSVVRKEDSQYLTRDLDELINEIEKGSQEKLSVAERKALRRQLLMDNLRNGGVGSGANPAGFVERYMNPDSFDDKYGRRHAGRLSAMFNTRYNKTADPLGKERLRFSQLNKQLGSSTRINTEHLQSLANAGYGDVLHELGLVDEHGVVDEQQYFQYLLGEQPHALKETTAAQAGQQRRRRPLTGLKFVGGGRASDRGGAARQGPYKPMAGQSSRIDEHDAQRIIDAIRDNNLKTLTESMDASLKSIELRLHAGVRTYGTDEEAEASGFFDKTLRQHARGARNWLGQAGHDLKKWWNEPGFASKHWGNRGKYAKGIAGMLRRGRDTIKQKWNEITEVYVKGEIEPRLTAWGFQHGLYFDAAGKAITSVKDITGAVFDAEGKPIMTLEEVKNAFMRSKVTQQIIDLGKMLKEKGVKAFQEGREWIKNTYGKTAAAVRKYVKQGQDWLDAQDVYVKTDLENPKLRATVMRAKGYRSFHRPEKFIMSPADIDGPVTGLDGKDQILTDEDIRTGLVDRYGRPLVTGKLRILQLGKDAFHIIKANIRTGLNAAKDFLTGKWKGLKDFFQIDGIMISGGKTMIDRLTEIRDLLNDRLPRRKKVLGDIDGDGLREGSFEDMKKKGQLHDITGQSKDWVKDKVQQVAEAVGGGLDGGKSGLLDGVMNWRGLFNGKGLFGGLKTKARNWWHGSGPSKTPLEALNKLNDKIDLLNENIEQQGDHQLEMEAAQNAGNGGIDLPDPGERGPGGRKRSRLERLKIATKRKMRNWRRKGGKAVLQEGLEATKDRLSKEGLKDAAKGAGEFVAKRASKGALKRGLWGATKLAGRGAWGLTKLGAGFGLDLLLGQGTAAAVGSLGIGSAIGSAVSAGAGLLGSLALAALPAVAIAAGVGAAGYGLYRGAKWLMRQKLDDMSTLRYIQYGFDPKGDDRSGAIFGLENMLEPHVQFVGGTPSLDGKALEDKKALDLFGVDKDDKDEVKQFASWYQGRFIPVFMVHMAAKQSVSPKTALAKVNDLSNADKLKYLDVAKYPGGPYDNRSNPFANGKDLPMGAKDVSTYAQNLIDKLKKSGDNAGAALNAKGKPVSNTVDTVSLLNQGTGRNPSLSLENSKSQYSIIRDYSDKQHQTVVSNTGSVMTVKGSYHAGQMLEGTKLDVLTSVRYKTYGLKTMELTKVKALMQLEAIIEADVTIDSKGIAQWKGAPPAVLSQVSGAFGVSGSSGGPVGQWYTWFNQRFLPTYLNYVTAMNKASPGRDLKSATMSLKPAQTLDVTSAITGSRSPETRDSVWKVTASPWPDYDMNTDVDTTQENIDAIKNVAEKGTVDQVTGLYTDQDAKNKKAANEGAFSKFLDKVTDAVGLSKKKNLDGTTTWAGMTYYTKDDLNKNSVENAIDTDIKGSGGQYGTLSGPKGAKGYDAMKDLITDASKQVGVDPKLALTIAGIESTFNPQAGAGTSSAKGLFQFIDGTWSDMLKKYGKQFGLPANASVYDPKANALMGAAYMKENITALQGFLHRPITPTDVYLSHLLGIGGAKTMLTADGGASAADLLPKSANSNKDLFFAGGKSRSVAEFYQNIQNLVKKRSSEFNIGLTGASSVVADKTGANATVKDGTKLAAAAASQVGLAAGPQAPQGLAGVANPVAANPLANLGSGPATMFNRASSATDGTGGAAGDSRRSSTAPGDLAGPPVSALKANPAFSPKPATTKMPIDTIAVGTALTANMTRQMVDQQTVQQSTFNQSLNTHQDSNNVLRSSLGVQQSMAKTLLDILSVLSGANKVAASAASPTPTLASDMPAQPAPKNLIDMRKPTFTLS